ncbi:hypothetical protein D3C85_1206180 [compost metagenome]
MVALVHAEHHHHGVSARALGHGMGNGARYHHGLVVQPHMISARLHRRPHEGEVRVVGDERFREDYQLHALAGGVVDGLADFGERPGAALQIGRDLDGGGPHDAFL